MCGRGMVSVWEGDGECVGGGGSHTKFTKVHQIH